MTTTKWTFSVKDEPHEVILKHGPIPGREIWLDGQLIQKGRVMPDVGSEHHFNINGQPVEVGIVAGALNFEHYLRVNNEFVFPSNKKSQMVGRLTQSKFKTRQAWIDFGIKHGLIYHPLEVKRFVFQHRLIGYIENFLVAIGVGWKQAGNTSIPVIYLLLRHENLDEEKIKEIKNNKELKEYFKNASIRADWFEVHSDFSIIFLSSHLEEIEDDVLVERILYLTPTLSKYFKPSLIDKCEGTECKAPYYKDLKLTFFNGIPSVMCQDCIDNVDNIGQKAQEEYKKSPGNLGKGIVYGLAAALLGAIAWALVIIFMDRIGAIFAVLILLLVVKAMDYARTKRSIISLLLAGLLSLMGSILGSYLGIVGILIKDKGEVLSLDLLIWLARRMIEEPKLINETILFSLIGLVPYLYITWDATRRGLKHFFKPTVEVIPYFKLH